MKRSIRLAVAVLLLVSAAALPGLAQGKGKIKGLVVDADNGQPLGGVTVRLFHVGTSSTLDPQTSDKSGKWSVYFLRTGMYNIDFEKPGFVPEKVSRRVNYPEEREEVLEVRMRRLAGSVLVKDTVVEKARKADAMFAAQKYDEARTLYQEMLTEDPTLNFLYKNIGNTWFAQEQYEKAIECYTKVEEKDPGRPDMAIAFANAYNNWGRRDEANQWYAKIPPADIKDIDTAYNAGVSLYNGGNPEGASAYFKKAVEIDPEFADGWYQLGMASVAQSKNEDAVAALNKFLALAPESPQAPAAKSILEAITKK